MFWFVCSSLAKARGLAIGDVSWDGRLLIKDYVTVLGTETDPESLCVDVLSASFTKKQICDYFLSLQVIKRLWKKLAAYI